MSWSDIQGTPVLVNLLYVPYGANPPPSSHELAVGPGGKFLESILLSGLDQQTQASVGTLLSTSLDQLFDAQWSQLQGSAQNMVQQAIQGAVPSAYSISVSFPQQGTLRAQTGALPAGMLPLGEPGTLLSLGYFLPGVNASFSEPSGNILPDPSYTLLFDGEIEIDIAVPTNPRVPLGIRAEFNATNLQPGAGNVWAVVNQLWDAISSFLTGQPIPSPDLSDKTVLIQVPGLFANLSTAFTLAANAGFTSLTALVVSTAPPPAPPGNTVELELIHPADPGPQVSNALAPSGPTFSSPQIGLSSPVVPAGGQDQVIGNSFPAAQASQLKITWTDTASGMVTKSEVQWGAAPSQGVPPTQPTDVTLTRPPHDNTFTATGLTPGAWYAFKVRDFDAEGLIGTGWSVPAAPPLHGPQPWDGIWAFFQTQATDQAELTLSYNNTVVGTATLHTDGTFSAPVTIPATVPPGTYQLAAALSGQQMAQTPITIIAEGQTPPPLLQILDPTGIPYQVAATVAGGSPVNLRGQNFAPGTVHLWVDSAGGTSLGTATADQNGSFATQPAWPWGITGPHNVLTEEGTQQATAPVYAEFPAQ